MTSRVKLHKDYRITFLNTSERGLCMMLLEMLNLLNTSILDTIVIKLLLIQAADGHKVMITVQKTFSPCVRANKRTTVIVNCLLPWKSTILIHKQHFLL